ncbi:MAG TPA: D-aminoacylase [Thermoanaerobaculia bacterium]|jgi:dihydroorotase/N-acyl-D-amino-acid deacylase
MKKAILAVPLSVCLLAALAAWKPADAPFDLLLTGGRVVDGSGAPWFAADVGVRDGKIAEVGVLTGRSAKRTIDARGLIVAPGFIDLLGQSEYTALVDKRVASKTTQGITTEVTGEGESIAPFNDRVLASRKDLYAKYGYTPDFRTIGGFLDTLEKRGTAVNLGTFVGAGSVRDLVIGQAERRATPEELAKMCDVVDQAMREGALGVSSSLQYVPDMYNSTDELIAMSKVAAKYGGAYFTHQRSETDRIDESLDEVFRIAKEAGIRAQIWHLKTAYASNFGRMPEVLKRIEDARARGIDVAANQYPWNRASNGLDACLPPWVREGGRDALLKRLADPKTRARVKEDMDKDAKDWENQWKGAGGAEGVMVAEVLSPQLKKYEGQTIAAIAKAENKDPRDVVIDIVIADRANAYQIMAIMDEKDVRTALASPIVSFGTDSQGKAIDGPFGNETSHPRGWGSATRILGYYVRDQKVLRLEEAVRKMTSFAAEAAGLENRGLIKEGFWADLAVFDPATVNSRATFEKPNQYSEGMPYVAVNGVLVVDGGKVTGAAPGKALRGPGYK